MSILHLTLVLYIPEIQILTLQGILMLIGLEMLMIGRALLVNIFTLVQTWLFGQVRSKTSFPYALLRLTILQLEIVVLNFFG